MRHTRLSRSRREQLVAQMRSLADGGAALDEVLSALAKTETTLAEAVEIVENVTGLARPEIEQALAANAHWGMFIQLIGGFPRHEGSGRPEHQPGS